MAQMEPTAEALQTTINLLTVLRDPTNPQVSMIVYCSLDIRWSNKSSPFGGS